MKYYLEYKKNILNLNVAIKSDFDYKNNNKIIRNPNFPSELSENLVMFCCNELFNTKMEWKMGADLWKKTSKYEVKAFVSGPVSFSPALDFEAIFFLDASDVVNGSFVLYHVRCNSNSFKNLKVNRNDSFKDFENKKKRPRCSFNFLLEQWRREKISVDFYKIDIDIKSEKILIDKLFFPI